VDLRLDSADDTRRRIALRAMKTRATGLLIVAAIIFVVARIFHGDHSWLDYVQAAAEGAMVGGLADWFAVTALFRHPMGIPIPHTALVPARKDQLGEALGEFVEDNFLSTPVIADKLRTAELTRRAADWVGRPGNAATLARHTSAGLAGAAGVLRDETVQGAIEQGLKGWMQRVELAPLAGRAIEIATAQGRHTELVDAGMRGVLRFLDEHREDLRGRFGRKSPWWVPESIDDRIFDKLFDGLRGFLTEVGETPDHDFRAYLDTRVAELAARLRSDPDLIARGEALKAEVLSHPAVRRWTGSLWADLKAGLNRQAGDPSSELRRRIESEAISLGRLLAADPELREKVDRWLESVLIYAVEEQRHQAGELIASTVARWDPDDASNRIELAVGRDLQFIRINGTVVGGLAGLSIYAIGQLIG
jgi:uncharacterized membrane-anchored protein YjiN (DUF445 family)